MEQEYKLSFSKPALRIKDISGKLPDFCRYPVPMAKKSFQFDFKDATLLQQLIPSAVFQIDIFQLDSKVPFVVNYTLAQHRIFLNFVLSGPILFTSHTGEKITHPASYTFYLSSEQCGSYRAVCAAGATDLIVVALDPQWLRSVICQYPILREAVSYLMDSNSPFDVLPHFRIDRHIREWLLGVLAFDHENTYAQLGELQKYLVMGLSHLEQLLASSKRSPLYLIKLRIDRNYADPNLDLCRLPQPITLSYSSIIRLFKKEYGLTIRNYCVQVRMYHAHRLLTQQHYTFAEVCPLVGYSNENSLRKAYRKYIGQTCR
jgi:AraC-like DNA-binding protein